MRWRGRRQSTNVEDRRGMPGRRMPGRRLSLGTWFRRGLETGDLNGMMELFTLRYEAL
jgi:predicted metalloprotease